MQTQLQIHRSMEAQAQAPVQSTETILSQRSTHEQRLKAPFTVFAKKLGSTDYSWIAYSLGKPRNIIWGTATRTSPPTISPSTSHSSSVDVSYGCAWNKLKIINDMIKIRQKDGYVAVSTVANDQISPRILAELIIAGYHDGTGIQWNNIILSNRELEYVVLDFLEQEGYITDSVENVNKIARSLAVKLLDEINTVKKNITQILPQHTGLRIPKEVIIAIEDFITHTPILNGTLPQTCPEYQHCTTDLDDLDSDGLDLETCDLYAPNFGLL